MKYLRDFVRYTSHIKRTSGHWQIYEYLSKSIRLFERIYEILLHLQVFGIIIYEL